MSDPAKQIRKLAQLVEDLRSGQAFSITRLTVVKAWCRDPKLAAEFAVHVAKLAESSLSARKRKSKKQASFEQMASTAVGLMDRYLKKGSKRKESQLWTILEEVRAAQDTYEKQRWATVRIIDSRELLIVETALECLLCPYQSEVLGYQIARQYCERYNSRFGTGLIPQSAPRVEEIGEFWSQYHLGKCLGEVLDNARTA